MSSITSPTTHQDARPPAFVVAATHSGAGKTTITAVVLRALRRKGLRVQPFKIGPDYIDPAYHTEATGRPSINLDVWMMGVDAVRASFERWSADTDICVVESMGALYDGANGTEEASTAQLAKVLGIPVVIVLDVWGMTRTAAAILEGLRAFDPAVNIAGCILNRVGSDRHEQMVRDALPDHLRRLVVGAVKGDGELEIPERHLGLVTVDENPAAASIREHAFERAGARLDLDRLVEIATVEAPAPDPQEVPTPERAPAQPLAHPSPGPVRTARRPRLAVARDPAFCFYYEENLRLLVDAGFDVETFSPTTDRRLPASVDAVYLGGGYPESFAAELAANVSLLDELRSRARHGLPVYAECGGLMYLARSLTGFDGVRHELVGVVPVDIAMDRSYLAIRYVEASTRSPSPFGEAGVVVRGHEFHHSRIVDGDVEPNLYDVTSSDGRTSVDGYQLGNVVASYLHVHFASNPSALAALAETAREVHGGGRRRF